MTRSPSFCVPPFQTAPCRNTTFSKRYGVENMVLSGPLACCPDLPPGALEVIAAELIAFGLNGRVRQQLH